MAQYGDLARPQMMSGQTFAIGDLWTVCALVVLEALLSADNALVLAIMVRHLPRPLQKRALLYGLAGAFIFRFFAILLAAVVLQLWWLQAVGAIYLLWLPIKHFVQHAQKKDVKPVGAGFWQTVLVVELTDIAFAIDSVLAGVTFIDNRKDKIWVVYLGAIIGLVLLRVAAGLFVRILERYPILDHVAYLLVGWVGVKLSFLAGHAYELTHPESGIHVPHMPPAIFWGGLLSIAGIGTFIALRNERKTEPVLDEQSEMIEGSDEPEADVPETSN